MNYEKFQLLKWKLNTIRNDVVLKRQEEVASVEGTGQEEVGGHFDLSQENSTYERGRYALPSPCVLPVALFHQH